MATAVLGCDSSTTERESRGNQPRGLVGCQEGGRATSALTEAERRASVVAGPLALVNARDLADQPQDGFDASRDKLRRLISDPSSREHERALARFTLARTGPHNYAIAEMRLRIEAGRQATITVPREHRRSAALVYTLHARNREKPGAAGAYRVADGEHSLTVRACEDTDTEFRGGIVVEGARCVPIRVRFGRSRVRRLLSFGADQCVTRVRLGQRRRLSARARQVLARAPYMGVACPTPNSIACDRIGLAIWLKEPARTVTATIAGHHLRLQPGGSAARDRPTGRVTCSRPDSSMAPCASHPIARCTPPWR